MPRNLPFRVATQHTFIQTTRGARGHIFYKNENKGIDKKQKLV